MCKPPFITRRYGYRSVWLSVCLLTALVARVRADDFSPPTVGALPPADSDLAMRVETLSTSQQQAGAQTNRILSEDAAITKRRDDVTSIESPGAEPANYYNLLSPFEMATAGRLDETGAPMSEDPKFFDTYGECKSLFDSFSHSKSKPWFEKLTIRGYSQIRFERTVHVDRGLEEEGIFDLS